MKREKTAKSLYAVLTQSHYQWTACPFCMIILNLLIIASFIMKAVEDVRFDVLIVFLLLISQCGCVIWIP